MYESARMANAPWKKLLFKGFPAFLSHISHLRLPYNGQNGIRNTVSVIKVPLALAGPNVMTATDKIMKGQMKTIAGMKTELTKTWMCEGKHFCTGRSQTCQNLQMNKIPEFCPMACKWTKCGHCRAANRNFPIFIVRYSGWAIRGNAKPGQSFR